MWWEISQYNGDGYDYNLFNSMIIWVARLSFHGGIPPCLRFRSFHHRWTCMAWDHHLWWPPSLSIIHRHTASCSLCLLLHSHGEIKRTYIFCMLTLFKSPTLIKLYYQINKRNYTQNISSSMKSESDIFEGRGPGGKVDGRALNLV